MTSQGLCVPIALFAYARPRHLARTLEGLRVNRVPLIYAFSDGPREAAQRTQVDDVRQILRRVDWCDLRLVERETNLGLGPSIRTGVADVLSRHDSLLVFEDDIVAIPGAYAYLCAALAAYADEPRVMSVSAWSHRRVTPALTAKVPFFAGRFACWGWGTWRRAWVGMDVPAEDLLRQCRQARIDPSRYGTDLPYMAREERALNIWAVRFAMLHLLHKAYCLYPPESMVDNIGVDSQATHTQSEVGWDQVVPASVEGVPASWPRPREHASVPRLWQEACGKPPGAIMRLKMIVARLRGRYPSESRTR